MTRTLAAVILGLTFCTPAAAQEVTVGWKDHPTVRAGKWLRVDFHARVQSDIRRSDLLTDKEAARDEDIAKRRVGVEGRFGNILGYEAEYELGSREWRDVYVDYRQLKAVQLQVGTFKVPFGLEQTTGITKLDFIYRSRISTQLTPGRDRGAMLHGKLWKSRLGYEAGVFRADGDNARSKKEMRVAGGRTAAARVVVEPWRGSKSEISDLQVGAAIAVSNLEVGLPSVRARTVFGESFFDSDVWVQGRRQRTGLEARWRPGPFTAQAEYIRLSDERRGQAIDDGDLEPLVAQGWYVSGSYRWRFIEAASRYETLIFGDASGNSDASTSRRAEIVLGNADRALTFGGTWFINRWAKLQANLIREALHDPSMGPAANRPVFWSRVLRLQVAL